MPRLVLHELTKTYPGGVRAVDAVSLTVEGDDLVVLVGPSGCGKTTLLRLLAGLETPSAGRIVLDGRDLARVSPAQRQVAMVFQDHALYPTATVFDNLASPLLLQRPRPADIPSQVRRTAERLGLLGLLTARPGELSGGERQRVALGRAILRRPALFLFDEPLSSLDAGLRRELRRMIRQSQREAARPALYVTHDQEEALALADQLVVLDSGRVRQIGPPREVHDFPADRFVAGFLGAGMNFVEGRLEMSEGRIRLRHSGGMLGPVTVPPQWLDQEMVLGFRPESLRIGQREGWPTIQGRVRLIEYQGDRVGVTLDASGLLVTGSFDTALVCTEGDELIVSVQPDLCHWFEPGLAGRRQSPGKDRRIRQANERE